MVGRAERGRGDRRRDRRARELREQHGEDAALMEQEEGGPYSPASSIDSESSTERDEKGLMSFDEKRSAKRRWCMKLTAIHVAVFVLFLTLLGGAYQISKGWRLKQNVNATSSQAEITSLKSNGTSLFAATTIMISLDGFRHDYLQRGLTPNLNRLVDEGVSPADGMKPSFPSVTFPNHHTIVTGLYPESHGIVGNEFWDPDTEEEFYYTHVKTSMQPHWWGGEPVYVYAEKSGLKTGIHMWPGSEAGIGGVNITYLDKYDGLEKLDRKIDRLLEWIDLPGPTEAGDDAPRPQLLLGYVPDIDHDGHRYGPNTTQEDATLRRVDGMIGKLLEGLDQRNLSDIVNVVIVSDHGMTTMSTDKLIQLDDLLDVSAIAHKDGYPLVGIWPQDPSQTEALHESILAKEETIKGFHVYTHATMPDRFHFTRSPRIAPLYLVPDVGWGIPAASDFNVPLARKLGLQYRPLGMHGWDHEDPLMRALFVARGPAFSQGLEGGKMQTFQNVEVYNMVCDSLGLEPKPNNGTSSSRAFRLPLENLEFPDAEQMAASTKSHTPPSTSPTSSPLAPTASPASQSSSSSSEADQPEDPSSAAADQAKSKAAADRKARLQQIWRVMIDRMHAWRLRVGGWFGSRFGGGAGPVVVDTRRVDMPPVVGAVRVEGEGSR